MTDPLPQRLIKRARRKDFKGRVLYVGQSFYHAWYLSRELRKRGWLADVLNWYPDDTYEIHHHGEDYRLPYGRRMDLLRHLKFYGSSILHYDVFHFNAPDNFKFGQLIPRFFERFAAAGADVRLLKRLGKKIVYSYDRCNDGVAQSSFAAWGPHSVCPDCEFFNLPSHCSDERNLALGRLRNELADYIVMDGGNLVDFNNAPCVHLTPEFYCLDPEVWNPDLLVPANLRLPFGRETVKVYHSVAHFELRTTRSSVSENRTIKSTHIYVPLIDQLRAEGHDVELVFCRDIPNELVRYYQVQSDIVVDMLTAGWFGANVREAMMLGKPAICYLRPEWLENVRREIPDYVEELPVVSATPETVHDVLVDLIKNPEKRRELGRRSREFALKWHSAENAAHRFDEIYTALLEGREPGRIQAPAAELQAAAL